MERGRRNVVVVVVVVGVTVVRMILSVARRGDEAGITSVGRERVSGGGDSAVVIEVERDDYIDLEGDIDEADWDESGDGLLDGEGKRRRRGDDEVWCSRRRLRGAKMGGTALHITCLCLFFPINLYSGPYIVDSKANDTVRYHPVTGFSPEVRCCRLGAVRYGFCTVDTLIRYTYVGGTVLSHMGHRYVSLHAILNGGKAAAPRPYMGESLKNASLERAPVGVLSPQRQYTEDVARRSNGSLGTVGPASLSIPSWLWSASRDAPWQREVRKYGGETAME
ncbi:hypothetical protein OIDMADRAFT_62025 [Oidiodendron maius Zn]|uniref:Uncharacterized protein n=1 Tax=Oidiodendron maius (strain Zn) TaxID=913774 RepID=A0A0C3C2D5_OIDMZ|nr:hypothetical protein OIDMADRAFT_62025 [Oidiodendron maius Zn]